MTPNLPPELPPELPKAGSAVRIEVCEKHGLRYNAEVADGCARCRTEAGERTVGRAVFSTQRAPDMKRSLAVAVALVVGIGGSLFAAHTVAYHAAKTLMDTVLDESFESFDESDEITEDDFDALFVDE